MSSSIVDRFGRPLKYLRISVTDRCNFSCRYCKPINNFEYIKHENLLTYEDLLFASEVFAELGVNRIRVTGGEPLVRKDLTLFLKKLTKINGINEVMVTTNGALLNQYAKELFDSGVKRLNISLDSLRKDRMKYITCVDKFDDVISGIGKAVKVGFNPVKVNVVVIKGFNDDELVDFCNFAKEEKVIVRFIEFMPIGNSDKWNKDSIITGKEILELLSNFEPIPLKKDENSGPAKNYLLNNGATIGIITPLSNHFCNDCDKLRLTSDGKIRPCLLSDKEIDLMPIIKDRNSNLFKETIINTLLDKSKEHTITCGDKNEQFKRTMSKIGG